MKEGVGFSGFFVFLFEGNICHFQTYLKNRDNDSGHENK
jgi:hypothetical protein